MKNQWSQIFTGAGIGFLFGGPLGALLGGSLAGGLASPDLFKNISSSRKSGALANDFAVLLSQVARADSPMVPEEARFIAAFFKEHFNYREKQLAAIRTVMKKAARQSEDVTVVAKRISMQLNRDQKAGLLTVLWELVTCDGPVDMAETRILDAAGKALGLTVAEQRGIAADFARDKDNYFRVLGVEEEDASEKIKAAYKKLARAYHPDRFAHIGGKKHEDAQNRFARINQAYNHIRKVKGF